MSSEVTVAIHQPNYIPWPGYFHKLAACDVFVYLDTVQYPRGRSFAARNRIKTPNGVVMLTIPVSVPKGAEGKASYAEVSFAEPQWQRKHLKTVEQSYRSAACFDEVFSLYAGELERRATFVELTIGLVESFCSFLGIETRRVRLSELLPAYGQKTDLVLDVCRAVGASTYLAGTGGSRDYLDDEELARNGVELRYDPFVTPPYPQLWGDFAPEVSMLDMLLNCGTRSRELLEEGARLGAAQAG